jgi:hypothetical protein
MMTMVRCGAARIYDLFLSRSTYGKGNDDNKYDKLVVAWVAVTLHESTVPASGW